MFFHIWILFSDQDPPPELPPPVEPIAPEDALELLFYIWLLLFG